jgi:transglutaminase-like putative cysteine protease
MAHLSPRTDVPGQVCTSHYLSVVPQPAVLEELQDHFGNRLYYFSIERPHREMDVTATSLIESSPLPAPPASTSTWRDFPTALAALPGHQQMPVRGLMLESPMVPLLDEVRDYARPSFDGNPGLLAAAADLMTRIFTEFKYDPAFTTLATPLRDVVLHRRGVCQDFAHLAIAALRSFGLAARYVSGYLETLPPAGQEKLVGADASHAWLSVFTPDAGWIDLDPTNNQHPDQRYITLAWGRDYSDVPPLKGVIFGGGTPKMTVAVDVEALT